MKKPGQWWDETWSPLSGCTPAGEGCRNCHSIRRMKRRLPVLRGKGNADVPPSTVLLHYERLSKPLQWRRPRIILTPMLGDLFHPDVPDDFLTMTFGAMMDAKHHTFVVLTKRYERAAEFVGKRAAWTMMPRRFILMASVWDQASADAACSVLSQLRGSALPQVRGVAWGLHCEPLLGPIVLGSAGSRAVWPSWVVTGGEAGPGARPMDPEWCLDLMAQCRNARVPYWHKSHGDVVKREMKRRGLSDVDPHNRLLDGEAFNGVPWEVTP